MNYRVFFVWVLLVILWNFGYPGATPIFDVLVSILLSIFAKFLESIIK